MRWLLLSALLIVQDPFSAERRRMVTEQIAARGVTDARVLEAMRTVPRHRFVPADARPEAYRDHPLPIGHGQTISQPFMVGFMTDQLEIEPEDVILEIGTGSGYQAAVLAELARKVYTIEIVAPLAEQADKTLKTLGYENIAVRHGDGYRGWPEHAPFDKIMVTAAPEDIPKPLIEQLKPGGKLVIPVGPNDSTQYLVVLEKLEDGTTRQRRVMPVRFVPFTGEAQDQEP